MTAVKLEDARRVVSAAEKKAREIGQPMNIAVADEGGNIVAHVRMDNAWIGSIDISMKKAYTSRAFDIETKELAKHSQSGGEFFGIHVSNNGKIMIFAGGIPLKLNGKVVGAIGVSGDGGSWIQVERGARPAQAVILVEERDAYLGGEPADDERFLAAFAHALEHTGAYTRAQPSRGAATLPPGAKRYDPTRTASCADECRTRAADPTT